MNMIKIQAVQRNTADEVSINGSKITINGTEYDLENPENFAVTGQDDQGNDILELPENQRVYLDSDGNTVLFLCYDTPPNKDYPARRGRCFMFQKSEHTIYLTKEKVEKYGLVKLGLPEDQNLENLPPSVKVYGSNCLRFFDFDENGFYDIPELEKLFTWWNAGSEEDMRAITKPILDAYLETHTQEEWIMKGV